MQVPSALFGEDHALARGPAFDLLGSGGIELAGYFHRHIGHISRTRAFILSQATFCQVHQIRQTFGDRSAEPP